MLAFYITAQRTDDDKLSLLCLFLANNLHLNYKRRITHKTKMAVTSESSRAYRKDWCKKITDYQDNS